MKKVEWFFLILWLTLITLVICLIPLASGCDSGFTAGAAVGGIASKAVQQLETSLAEKEAELLKAQQERIIKLESTADDAEKIVLQSEIKALKHEISKVQGEQAAIEIGGKAVTTDWSDPEQITPWILTLLSAGSAVVLGKQKRTLGTVLKQVNQGINKFSAQAEPSIAEKLYSDVKKYTQ